MNIWYIIDEYGMMIDDVMLVIQCWLFGFVDWIWCYLIEEDLCCKWLVLGQMLLVVDVFFMLVWCNDDLCCVFDYCGLDWFEEESL